MEHDVIEVTVRYLDGRIVTSRIKDDTRLQEVLDRAWRAFGSQTGTPFPPAEHFPPRLVSGPTRRRKP